MSNKTQIGWYHLKEDTKFYNTFECAAWYEEVLVKAGKYPAIVYDFAVTKDNTIKGHIDSVYVPMDGVILSDEFGARFCGVPVGSYDNYKNAGKQSNHQMVSYMYSVAKDILYNPETSWELFPEYEPRQIDFEYDGEMHHTHGIFKKG